MPTLWIVVGVLAAALVALVALLMAAGASVAADERRAALAQRDRDVRARGAGL